jgi:hypothetical protein
MEMIARLRSRVDALIARAVIARVNDAMKTQRFQLTILEGEPADNVEHFQPYGLSFVPPAGAECLALAIGGVRAHTVAICAQHPDQRPKDGDPKTGGLYTSGQWRLFIDADGVVHGGAETGEDFVALAQLVLDRVQAIHDKFDAHTHIVTGTAPPGTAGGPITAGSAQAPTDLLGPADSVAATKFKAK